MQVNVKLFAGLSEYLPPGSLQNSTLVLAAEAATINELIARLNVPPTRVHLVLLNGVYMKPDQRDSARLRNGDTLAMWPPVAGG